jgi:hypothetical protein
MSDDRPAIAESPATSRVNRRTALAKLSADQVRERAREYRDMAATARPAGVPAALLRLVEPFEALAQRKAKKTAQQLGSRSQQAKD